MWMSECLECECWNVSRCFVLFLQMQWCAWTMLMCLIHFFLSAVLLYIMCFIFVASHEEIKVRASACFLPFLGLWLLQWDAYSFSQRNKHFREVTLLTWIVEQCSVLYRCVTDRWCVYCSCCTCCQKGHICLPCTALASTRWAHSCSLGKPLHHNLTPFLMTMPRQLHLKLMCFVFL